MKGKYNHSELGLNESSKHNYQYNEFSELFYMFLLHSRFVFYISTYKTLATLPTNINIFNKKTPKKIYPKLV